MFISISTDTVLKTADIIGIFDLDTATQTQTARDFFKRAEKEGRVKMSGSELPKSFLVMRDGTVYLSQYSAKILTARTKYAIR